MIKEIFIPDIIDSYYVLTQHILGVSITKTHVRATKIVAKGKTIRIEGFFEKALAAGEKANYQERVVTALRAIMATVGKVTQIRTALSSSLVTVKQLTLPFTDPEKIRMVLPYEIESQLPFALETAVIDFIITSTDTEKKQTTLLVAAVQKEQIATHLGYFKAADITPSVVSIDLFDIYGLYRMIPAYDTRKGTTVLLDVEAQTTRLLYLVDNQLMRIRTIGQGMAYVAKAVGEALHINNGQSIEQIMRFGVKPHEHEGYHKALTSSLATWWQSIQFTLNSFTAQTPNGKVDTILLLGNFAIVPGMSSFITEQSSIPCRLFETHLLFDNPRISGNTRKIPDNQIFSLSAALPTPTTTGFNLLQQEFAPDTLGLFTKQIITAGILVVLVIGALLGNSIFQTNRLGAQVKKAQQEAFAYLQELDLVDEETVDLSTALEDADTEIKKQEDQWFAFSRKARTSLLHILQQLSAAIDRKSIGLQLKKLAITEKYVELEGSVKDYDELNIFEQELKDSGLFGPIPKSQKPSFSKKLMLKEKKQGAI